jgi:hypothetical protein
MKSFMMMTEIDVADFFGIAEALGIIGPSFKFYTFSRIQNHGRSLTVINYSTIFFLM